MAQYFHQMKPADGVSVGGTAPSTKVSKVRDGKGATVLSQRGGLWKRKKMTRGVARVQTPQQRRRMRSWVANMRGYYRGETGLRGAGRETGTDNPLASASRADLSKISAPGRIAKVGFYLPKVGG